MCKQKDKTTKVYLYKYLEGHIPVYTAKNKVSKKLGFNQFTLKRACNYRSECFEYYKINNKNE